MPVHPDVHDAGQAPVLPSGQRVAVLAFEGAQLLDVIGPLEVFNAASLLAGRTRMSALYRVLVLSAHGGPIRGSSGLEVGSTPLAEVAPQALHTVLVAGGPGMAEAASDPCLLAWLRAAAVPGGARRIGSVCTGAFLLAAAGLLDGRRAVTHWAHCARLAVLHPTVCVEPDPIFVKDGTVWTSAGVTAGMDLALALVEEDHGRGLALGVARNLVMFLKRPGGQAQFSASLAAQLADDAREPIRAVRNWTAANPSSDLRVEALATRAGMSPRTFARAFAATSGTTPARFVEHVRLDAARRLLEDTALPVETVAGRCGFGSAEVMRRAFGRRLGTAPADYRKRFRRTASFDIEEHAA